MNEYLIAHLFELGLIGQICLALILGAIVGFQREIVGRSAGARTYALVAAGSTLFTILSVVAFCTDTARVAANIVVGIGFLGAGTILHKVNHVEGLTTAAGLWAVAAVGMAVGLGYYILATVTTILVLLVLIIDDKKMLKKEKRK